MDTDSSASELPLFPLRAVLFPGGLLALKVFEARYLDMVTGCPRERQPFGVVALRRGAEVRTPGAATPLFEAVGTRAELLSADSEQAGILRVRCRGTQRFRIDASRQQVDGLWLARTHTMADDAACTPGDALARSVDALATMMQSLKAQDQQPFLEPARLDDAGWVANRWCEILPITQAARQKLMELDDPLVRLQLVDDFLRSKGVLS